MVELLARANVIAEVVVTLVNVSKTFKQKSERAKHLFCEIAASQTIIFGELTAISERLGSVKGS